MLNNAIGLLAIAALFGITAFQHRSERAPLIAFGVLALIFLGAAIWLPGLTAAYPRVGAFISGAFDDPAIYVVLGVGLFFVVRAFWQPKSATVAAPSGNEERGAKLGAKVNRHDAAIAEIRVRLEATATVEAVAEIVAESTTALRETIKVHDDKVRTRLGVLETQYPKVIDDYQRMTGLEARFEDALDGLKRAIQAQNKTFEDRHFIDERNLTEFREAVLKSNAQLFLALQAIRARETERFYAAIIEEEGASLQAKVINNEPFQGDDWAGWEVHQIRLDSALHHWLELADGWHPQVRAWINEIHPGSLTSPDWGDIDDLFQRHGQAIMYKTQIAKFNNWMRLRNHVASAIHVAAFGGPHADEILETIPGGGPTVERVKE